MSMSRMVLTIVLILYLIIVPILLGAIGNTYNVDIGLTTNEYEVHGNPVSNMMTGLSILPLSLQALLVGLPITMFIVIVVTLFFPAGNAGA